MALRRVCWAAGLMKAFTVAETCRSLQNWLVLHWRPEVTWFIEGISNISPVPMAYPRRFSEISRGGYLRACAAVSKYLGALEHSKCSLKMPQRGTHPHGTPPTRGITSGSPRLEKMTSWMFMDGYLGSILVLIAPPSKQTYTVQNCSLVCAKDWAPCLENRKSLGLKKRSNCRSTFDLGSFIWGHKDFIQAEFKVCKFVPHPLWRSAKYPIEQNAQVSLKSVRILCVIQLRFRTVVVQVFLIKPCAFKLQLLLHFVNMCQRTCQVQSSKMHRSAWSQYESCVSFNSDSELW